MLAVLADTTVDLTTVLVVLAIIALILLVVYLLRRV